MEALLKRAFVTELSKCQTLLNSVVRRVKTASDFEKEDLTQEILINAWKAYPKFKGESKFSTWLYRIGILTVYQSYRKKRNYKMISFSEASRNEHPCIPINWNPESELDHLLRDDIDLRTFKLYVGGHTYQEISSLLGISVNLVGVKIHRTRKKLAKFY